MVLGVQGAEIQPHQRHPEAAGDRLGQQRLAAALHAQQQHALGRVQPRRRVALGEHAPALFDPALEPARTGHVGELRGVVFVVQVARSVEQFELELRQLRQVALVERAVVEHQLPGDAAGIAQRQPLQVAHNAFDGLRVLFHAAPAVLGGEGLRLLVDHAPQRGRVGQARAIADGLGFQLPGQFHPVSHQHQGVRQAVATLQDVAHLALAAAVFQVGVEIQQQVHPALGGGADGAQRGAHVGRDLGRVLSIQVDPAQAFGDRPPVHGPPHPGQGLAEHVHRLRLVGGLDHDQRGAGSDQRGQVLHLAHGARKLVERRRTIADPGSPPPPARCNLDGPVLPEASG